MLDNDTMLRMKQSQPTPQEYDARKAAYVRENYGLPADATDEEVSAAYDDLVAAYARECFRKAASRLGGTALQ